MVAELDPTATVVVATDWFAGVVEAAEELESVGDTDSDAAVPDEATVLDAPLADAFEEEAVDNSAADELAVDEPVLEAAVPDVEAFEVESLLPEAEAELVETDAVTDGEPDTEEPEVTELPVAVPLDVESVEPLLVPDAVAVELPKVIEVPVDNGMDVECVEPADTLTGMVEAEPVTLASEELTDADPDTDCVPDTEVSDTDCAAEIEDATDDAEADADAPDADLDAEREDRTEEVEATTELAEVVTGTGIAVVPSAPEDVLRVKIGALLAEAVIREPETSVIGTGTTVRPLEPVSVLDVKLTEAVADAAVADEMTALTLETSEASVAETVDRTPESCEFDAVAVTMLDKSEPREDARLDRALEAAAVTLAGRDEPSLARLEATLCTEAFTVAATLDAAPTAEERKLDKASLVAVGAAVGVTMSEPESVAPLPVPESVAPLPVPVSVVPLPVPVSLTGSEVGAVNGIGTRNALDPDVVAAKLVPVGVALLVEALFGPEAVRGMGSTKVLEASETVDTLAPVPAAVVRSVGKIPAFVLAMNEPIAESIAEISVTLSVPEALVGTNVGWAVVSVTPVGSAEPAVNEKICPTTLLSLPKTCAVVVAGWSGTGLTWMMLWMTVDKPTKMEPLSATDAFAEAVTELPEGAVGETIVSGMLLPEAALEGAVGHAMLIGMLPLDAIEPMLVGAGDSLDADLEEIPACDDAGTLYLVGRMMEEGSGPVGSTIEEGRSPVGAAEETRALDASTVAEELESDVLPL
ncbi:hypothetical protein LTR62_000692 [Meristemomyces frigidus]|uniref:Uncharacterized protein n=1 Tax=Meristemomyces frigidus TaxID=1508187 RepID=A0AAN7THI1_9PEZI|nr:hypothetical protein LTR62_000692 [Meristemomyces frigidus]